MIWLIWLAVLAGAVGQPLCDPQCHFTEQGPYTVDPALSICVSAGLRLAPFIIFKRVG